MIQSESAREASSSPNSGNLRLDFYESGEGDTVVITFPGGGVGIVDAHPSPTASRAGILDLVAGKRLHFVCLTHPHADHGRDLVAVLEKHENIAEFWHTTSDIAQFIYRLQEVSSWPSSVREFAHAMASDFANFLIDLYGAVSERDVPVHQIRAGEDVREYDGVQIHSLSPEESNQQAFLRYWLKKADDPIAKRPDPNSISAVFALRWGKSVVLLGADALRANWQTAIRRYRRLRLPKAILLKVPHHGASNAMESHNSKLPSYLDICLHEKERCRAVLFAGDAKHPDPRVYDRLRARTDVHCLVNGLRGKETARDLGIELEGARPAQARVPCQPVVSFELTFDGKVELIAGHSCDDCQFRE